MHTNSNKGLHFYFYIASEPFTHGLHENALLCVSLLVSHHGRLVEDG